jgi:hypothetical protein
MNIFNGVTYTFKACTGLQPIRTAVHRELAPPHLRSGGNSQAFNKLVPWTWYRAAGSRLLCLIESNQPENCEQTVMDLFSMDPVDYGSSRLFLVVPWWIFYKLLDFFSSE